MLDLHEGILTLFVEAQERVDQYAYSNKLWALKREARRERNRRHYAKASKDPGFKAREKARYQAHPKMKSTLTPAERKRAHYAKRLLDPTFKAREKARLKEYWKTYTRPRDAAKDEPGRQPSARGG